MTKSTDWGAVPDVGNGISFVPSMIPHAPPVGVTPVAICVFTGGVVG